MKKLIIALLLILSLPHFSSAAVFTDVDSNHPNAVAIHYLFDNGVIGGYENGTFRPEKKVNRAEALKIILLGSNINVPELQDQEIFPDVFSSAWYGKFAAKAKNLQIVKGDADTGLFRPGDTVNLAEALKILILANNKTPVAPNAKPYADVESDAWYSAYFGYAQGAKLLDQNSNETVNPSTAITRGALAELMYRLSQSHYIQPDGKASYYGEKFHGKTTASGAIFDASEFTAAHRTYPFDTWVKVTNVDNGESVVVKINDRGPYSSDDRVIDLSKAAFEAIAPLSRGIIEVALEEVSNPNEAEKPITPLNPLFTDDVLNKNKVACPAVASLQNIDKNFFTKVTLSKEIPNRLLLDEVLTLSGSTELKYKEVTAFVIDGNNKQTAFTSPVSNGQFSIQVKFPSQGNFKLGLLPGQSGQSVIKEVQVLNNNCIEEVDSSQLPSVSGLNLNIDNGDTTINWNPGNYQWFKVTFAQGNLYKNYIVNDVNQLTPVYREFSSFKSSEVRVSIRGASISDNSILRPNKVEWSSPAHLTFLASDHHEFNVNLDEIKLKKLTKTFQKGDFIEVQFSPHVAVRSEAAVILPNGTVQEVDLISSGNSSKKNVAGIEVYSASSDTLTARFATKIADTHFLEINNDQGLAVVNVPVFVNGQYPLLPNRRDLSSESPAPLSGSTSDWRNQMLQLVNQDRQKQSISGLKLDSHLNDLAQSRSDDMVANNYFSHWDQQGRDANDLKANYAIQTLVGENLARDLSLELAQYGLMRSAIHRSNILSEDWTRVGFGITKASDESYIIVQIFSSDPIDLSNLEALRSRVSDTINKNRGSNINLQSNLNTLAQNWTVKMANEEFFDFVDKNGLSLVTTIRDSGIIAGLGTYILGNSSFSDALEQLKDNQQINESKWKNLGVGIQQDKLGIINITLIYTE